MDPLELFSVAPVESKPIQPVKPGSVGTPEGNVANTGSSTAQQDQARNALIGQIGAVLDFTAPQPFNDRLLVFTGVSSDINRTVGQRQSFVFEINPQRLQRTKHKNQSTIFLGRPSAQAVNSRFSPAEFHYLSQQYEQFAYSGVTPAFNPLRNGGRTGQGDILPGASSEFGDYATSPGWLWFLSFQDFYDEYCDQFVTMKWANNLYVGVLDDFNYNRDANAPFNIRYSLTFRSVYTYDLSVGMGTTFLPGAGRQGAGDLVQRIIVRPQAALNNLLGSPQAQGLEQQMFTPWSGDEQPDSFTTPSFKSYLQELS